MKPNILCHLTEGGQVVYEVMETLEPLTELVVQYRDSNNYINNNNEESNRSKFSVNANYDIDDFRTANNEIVPFSFNTRVFSPSRILANLLLIDAIAGIVRGKILVFRYFFSYGCLRF